MDWEAPNRVVTEVLFENLHDLYAVERALIPPDRARRLLVTDALVHTRVIPPWLPSRLIRKLGLERVSSGGLAWHEGIRCDPVRLTILGRSCIMDMWEVTGDAPAGIGLTVMTHLDLVVDPIRRTLNVNPAHGGEWMHEMY